MLPRLLSLVAIATPICSAPSSSPSAAAFAPSSSSAAAASSGGGAPWLWVHSPPSLSLAVDGNSGRVAHVNASAAAGGWAGDVDALSWLGEGGTLPLQVGAAAISRCGAGGAAVCVTRTLNVRGQKPDGSCCANYSVEARDVYAPAPAPAAGSPSSVSWSVSMAESASGVSWRTSIVTQATFAPAAANASDALAWAARAQRENGAAGVFDDVTRMLGASDAALPLRLQLGRGFIFEPAIAANRDVAPLLASAVASRAGSNGLALLEDPGDTVFAATEDVALGSVSVSRLYNRLGAGARTVNFTTYFVPLAGADWRPAFAWARAALPRYFLPVSLLPVAGARRRSTSQSEAAAGSSSLAPTGPAVAGKSGTGGSGPAPLGLAPPAHLRLGLGMYTCADASELDASFLHAAGATHIWDAHFFWPYQGMFLPPNETWTSNLGGGEETDCGSAWSHGSRVDRARVARSYAAAEASNLTTLAYLNLFHFGQDVRVVPGAPLPPTPDAWTNSSLFIAEHLSDSLLPGPVYDWQNSVVMDAGAPSRAAFLAAQVSDKLASFGALLSGVVVDELEPTKMVIMQASGGGGGDGWDVAWCGQPCRFLLSGWLAAASEAAAALHGPAAPQPASGARVLLVNFVGAMRLDVLGAADGVFSEDYVSGGHAQLLSSTGLATTGKPAATIWTYDWAEAATSPGGPDAFLQQHLFFRAFPMAPAFGADHSIDNSTAAAAQAFLDYGSLSTSLIGACWFLAPNPVAVEGSAVAAGVLANAFTSGGGCTDAETDSGNGPVGALLLFAWQPPGSGNGSGAASAVALSFVLPAFAPGAGRGVAPGELPTIAGGARGGIAPDELPVIAGGARGGKAPDCEAAVPGAVPAWTPLPAPSQSTEDGRWRFPDSIALGRGCVMVRCVEGAAAM